MSVDRQGWIPKLELGYRRNTESGVGFNGVVVGFSLPLFSNRHHVRASRAQLTNSKYLKRAADVQLRSELAQRYAEARSLQSTIQAYRNALQGTRNIDLLRRALEGGEINITDYFVESAVVYQSQLNLLNLESRYRKALANLYKNSL
jgi:outer membrane protein TolC